MTDDTGQFDEDAALDTEGAQGELERLRAENAQLKDQALRYAAEAENTRRRAEKEANDSRAYAIQRFARDLLGVADNLSRALQHAPRDDADPAVRNFVVGIEMTDRELNGAFERNGLKKIDPERGGKFDPHLHQAMAEQPADDVPGGAVVQVMQAGYELFGRIVRPAMVVVAPKGSGPQASAGGASDAERAQNGYGGPSEAAPGGTLDAKA